MSNWKTGWCIGEEIEMIPNELQQDGALVWYVENPIEVSNHLGDIFKFLGSEDGDIVYLYFLLKKRQIDICQLLDKTQPAISYDIKRVKKHIDFAIYLVSVVDEFVYFLNNHADEFPKEQINILILVFFSTSFTKTSEVLNYHQITCRNRFNKFLKELRKKGFGNIVEIFETILNNLNMVKKTIYKN